MNSEPNQQYDAPETEQVVPAEFEGVIDVHADDDLGEEAIIGIEEAPRPWRLAEALKTLRAQVNAAAPKRGKASDGSIGDPAHQSRASDHNPWVIDGGQGVVTALDVTHDPANGCDAGLLAETLRKAQDARIKYIISNQRIASSQPKNGAAAFAWRPYKGRNPHSKHCHISVQSNKARYDSTAQWPIGPAFKS